MRAVYDSLDREGEMQRQLRRTKEALVATALKLQVAMKVAQEDQMTINSLQAMAEEAKAKEIEATKRSEEALEIINALNLEVNRMKRKIRNYESERQAQNPTGILTAQQHQLMNEQADDEVEDLLNEDAPIAAPKDISGHILAQATPFDRWKMSEFLFTPDTPAASAAHDKHVVDMLVDATNHEIVGDFVTRPTKGSIAKLKQSRSKGYANNETIKAQLTTLGSNDYEVINGFGEIDFQTSSPTRPGTMDKEDRKYFFNTAPEQQWGSKPVFNRDDMGRMNLWATNDPVKPASQHIKKSNSGVKLKSLRVDQKASTNRPKSPGNHIQDITAKLQKVSV